MAEEKKNERKPGVCIPWEQKLKEMPNFCGDEELARKTWEELEGLAYTFMWFTLLW